MVEVRGIGSVACRQERARSQRGNRRAIQRPQRAVRAATTPQKTPKPALYLQVGAPSERANAAEQAAAKVRAAHLGDVRVVEGQVNSKTVQRVRLGPLKDADEVDRLTPRLRDLGLGELRVAVDN